MKQRAAESLLTQMQTLSNRFYGARWASGIEYTLYESILIGPIPIEGQWLDHIAIDELRTLSGRCEGWWYENEEGTLMFVSIPAWLEHSGFRATAA